MSQRITRSKTRRQDPAEEEKQKVSYVEKNNPTSAMEDSMEIEHYPFHKSTEK